MFLYIPVLSVDMARPLGTRCDDMLNFLLTEMLSLSNWDTYWLLVWKENHPSSVSVSVLWSLPAWGQGGQWGQERQVPSGQLLINLQSLLSSQYKIPDFVGELSRLFKVRSACIDRWLSQFQILQALINCSNWNKLSRSWWSLATTPVLHTWWRHLAATRPTS